MTLRQYLILMSIGTALCWLVWFLVISNIDPKESGWLGFILFYISLYLALTGAISVIGFIVKKRITQNDEIVFHHVHHTFRQGLLIALLFTTTLMMLQFKVLNWWTGLTVVLLFLVMESMILANRKYKNRDYLRQGE